MRILSISPGSGRIGYAYFEGMDLVDRGIRSIPKGTPAKTKSLSLLDAAEELIQFFQPEVILLPDGAGRRSEAGKARLIRGIHLICGRLPAELITFSPGAIQTAFQKWTAPCKPTKERILRILSGLFPELEPMIPKPRQPWEAQDYWLPALDAIARVVAWIEKTEGLASVA